MDVPCSTNMTGQVIYWHKEFPFGSFLFDQVVGGLVEKSGTRVLTWRNAIPSPGIDLAKNSYTTALIHAAYAAYAFIRSHNSTTL